MGTIKMKIQKVDSSISSLKIHWLDLTDREEEEMRQKQYLGRIMAENFQNMVKRKSSAPSISVNHTQNIEITLANQSQTSREREREKNIETSLRKEAQHRQGNKLY